MNKTALGVVIGLLGATAARGATEVEIRDFASVPATVAIEKGEDVKWTDLDSAVHTSTSDTLVWDSGDINPNESYKRKFNKAGFFPYYCKYHTQMKGTVRVTETPIEPNSLGRVKALFR